MINEVKNHLTIFLLIALFALCSFPVYAKKQVRIAVLNFDSNEVSLQRWQPTIDYLNSHSTELHYSLILADIVTITELAKKNIVDFIISNGVQFLKIKHQYRYSKVLNLSPLTGDSQHAIGSVIIGKKDRAMINDWKMLERSRIISSSPAAFGGFQIMMKDLYDSGTHVVLNNVSFVGIPQSNVIEMVAKNKADFGIIPTCLLEKEQAKENKNALAVSAKYILKTQDDFSCVSSSKLYPNIGLSVSHTVPSKISNITVKLLLSIQQDNPIAKAGEYKSWSAPVDDSSVYSLVNALKVDISPFWITIYWQKYDKWIIAITLSLLLFFIYHLTIERKVYQRTKQLQDESLKHQQTSLKLEQETHQLFQAQRVLLAGEMASGLAHEITQPLTTISIYASGCRRQLDSNALDANKLSQVLLQIENQTNNAKEIIQRMRGFMSVNDDNRKKVDINEIIEQSLKLFNNEATRKAIAIDHRYSCESYVFGDNVLLTQVITNILKNAIDSFSMMEHDHKKINVITSQSSQYIIVHILDNGFGLTEQQIKKLFMPFNSTKKNGIGLGMVICKKIINEHNGQIHAVYQPQGALIEIKLPKYVESNSC
ncbi:ATP-binding protein [Photobacterium sp.]|uniref:sensor histidine kinase n=1 Tax=Photobacterium sp. TaxID=660 RepID=UPI00299DAC82|nr:ATP-binding protein [Photobacterium sp.]MDX1302667.1 PhnD/SsuA/transferrin family substrate-binding protein [Photobacterium sp.]